MSSFRLVTINALIFVALLFGIEFYFRAKSPPASVIEQANGLQLRLLPYVEFTNFPDSYYSAWVNIFTGQTQKADIRANNEGYNDPRKFDWRNPYAKAPNEKVVLLVGGSTVWGVGSSTFDATIAGQMQAYLNRNQSSVKYTVINLGMGSWIAYQQFIGLEMWGASFNPDWVVIMDGHNDAGVGCANSQGVTNPLFFPVIKSYIDAYLGAGNTRPVFYRGWFENELIRFSAAYRTITGKRFISNPQVYDETNKDATRDELRKVIVPTKIGAARDMLRFYVKATDASLSLFPHAKYILSTQPMANVFTGDFVDVYKPGQSEADAAAMAKREQDLELYLKATENDMCNSETYIPSFTYVWVKGAFELEKLAAAKRAEGRFVEYDNIGRVFPNERADRLKYFMDAAHLSDEGAAVIGKFFGSRILAADGAVH
jgi:hypothetical protein